ncbi:GntR family transcriptional regulator [Amycolatopsis sp. NPDC006125]|uniref:GntR family transcriptional regulator n=1 Tax=Amycolatopsis sp. NPDC006125 TaxID=3156730 RepID=UPI0033AED209
MEMLSAALAPFERVAESVRRAVRSGEWEPGHKLPSNREMAKEHGVSLATLQKAIALLQDEGWLVSRASVGVFVADNPPKAGPAVSLEDLRQSLDELRDELGRLQARVAKLESEKD